MVTLGYSAGPLLVLLGTWALIAGFDDPRYDTRRALTAGLGCVLVGLALTFGTIVVDKPEPAPTTVPADRSVDG